MRDGGRTVDPPTEFSSRHVACSLVGLCNVAALNGGPVVAVVRRTMGLREGFAADGLGEMVDFLVHTNCIHSE